MLPTQGFSVDQMERVGGLISQNIASAFVAPQAAGVLFAGPTANRGQLRTRNWRWASQGSTLVSRLAGG